VHDSLFVYKWTVHLAAVSAAVTAMGYSAWRDAIGPTGHTALFLRGQPAWLPLWAVDMTGMFIAAG